MIQELTGLRQKNTKVYDIGEGKRTLVCSLAALHYKGEDGQWQDIDTRFQEADTGNYTAKFTKLPYVIRMGDDCTRRIYPDRDDLSYWIELGKPFKNMGKPTKIGKDWVWDYPHATIKVRVGNESVKFSFILKDSKSPTSITFPFSSQGITRDGRLLKHNGKVIGRLARPTAIDANEVDRKVDVKFAPGEVTLSIDTTGLTFPVIIDPTYQVGTGDDDCQYRKSGTFDKAATFFRAGYTNTTYQGEGGAARFLNVAIAAGSTIDSAVLRLTARSANTQTVVRSRIRCEQNINSATFDDETDFNARTWTTEFINWDGLGSWVIDSTYDSDDFKLCVQEVIDLASWASGNPVTIYWDDKEERSDQVASHYRDAYSYEGSSGDAPQLVITFTPPAPPDAVPQAFMHYQRMRRQG